MDNETRKCAEKKRAGEAIKLLKAKLELEAATVDRAIDEDIATLSQTLKN